MEKSTNYNFNLPNSANDEIADINDISDNFRIIDEKLKIDQTFSETSEKPQSGKAIAEEIGKKQDYFANAFKGTASGASIRVDNVSPIEHTLGVKVSSKNLIPFYNRHGTATDNGITYTIDDLIIIANGTVTGNQSQYFLFNGKDIKTGVLNVDPAETFYISGCPEGGSDSTYYLDIQLYKNTTYIISFRDVGNGFLLYQPNVDYNRVLFKMYIKKGTTANNLIFKIQMERGSTAPYLVTVAVVKSER